MKKLVTICLLFVALLAWGQTLDAKTTKKKSKARTTQTVQKSNSNNFGINTFCRMNKDLGPIGKDVHEIIASLEKLGFKYQDTYDSTYTVYDDETGEEYVNKVKVQDYSNGNISVSIYIRMYNNELMMDQKPYQIFLMFNKSSEEKNFIANLNANGFSAHSEDFNTYYVKRNLPGGVRIIKTEGADEMFKIEFFEAH